MTLQPSGDRIQSRLPESVQRHAMTPVKRPIHELRDQALDSKALSADEPHQAADGARMPERDQGSVIAIPEPTDLVAARVRGQDPRQVLGLLVSDLRTRW